MHENRQAKVADPTILDSLFCVIDYWVPSLRDRALVRKIAGYLRWLWYILRLVSVIVCFLIKHCLNCKQWELVVNPDFLMVLYQDLKVLKYGRGTERCVDFCYHDVYCSGCLLYGLFFTAKYTLIWLTGSNRFGICNQTVVDESERGVLFSFHPGSTFLHCEFTSDHIIFITLSVHSYFDIYATRVSNPDRILFVCEQYLFCVT